MKVAQALLPAMGRLLPLGASASRVVEARRTIRQSFPTARLLCFILPDGAALLLRTSSRFATAAKVTKWRKCRKSPFSISRSDNFANFADFRCRNPARHCEHWEHSRALLDRKTGPRGMSLTRAPFAIAGRLLQFVRGVTTSRASKVS